jgi:hypothetical protein
MGSQKRNEGLGLVAAVACCGMMLGACEHCRHARKQRRHQCCDANEGPGHKHGHGPCACNEHGPGHDEGPGHKHSHGPCACNEHGPGHDEGPGHPHGPGHEDDPIRMLDVRFAKGEIDEADYLRRREILKGTH